ncbi:hypothetical protein RND81_12G230700 [Saponaria officinalis]|uniref:B box-type domain-containing protein n=1 Tax=Saponaria officinalis TaxID=3572 RepID=A0AAW1HEH2_SAPOF
MKNKVVCELCDAPANINCDSDRASLCWRCDNKVHRANFLVAKHNRCLLCHICQAMTPWTASGPRVPPSLSLCLSCVSSYKNNNTSTSVQSCVNDDDDEEEEEEDDNDENESSLYVDENEEDIEMNQVVPLTALSSIGVSVTPSSMEEVDESYLLTALPSLSLKRNREIFLSS